MEEDEIDEQWEIDKKKFAEEEEDKNGTDSRI